MKMESLSETRDSLLSALKWFSKTEIGLNERYSIDPKYWRELKNKGFWHLLPICTAKAADDQPWLTPHWVCLRIDLRKPASEWPIVLALKDGECITLASSPKNLAFALNNDRSTSSDEYWVKYNDIWRELHNRVGGKPEDFEWLGQQIADGNRIRLSTSDVDQEAAESFAAFREGEAIQENLVPETSPWLNSVNSRVLHNLTLTSIQQGNSGRWDDGVYERALTLLKSPNSFDADNRELTSLRSGSVASAWYYLYGALEYHLIVQPDLPVPDLYRKIIEHGAHLGLSGVQHFELAAYESSQNNDQVTAFHHLISAAFWSLQNTQTELPEAFEMAQHVAQLQGNQDAIDALKIHQS